jgi:hypothetical protein
MKQSKAFDLWLRDRFSTSVPKAIQCAQFRDLNPTEVCDLLMEAFHAGWTAKKNAMAVQARAKQKAPLTHIGGPSKKSRR